MNNYIKLDPEDRKIINLFNRNVEWLKKREANAAPKSWVKPAVIKKKYGWSRAQLDTARRNGYINHKLDGDNILYDPQSINQDYIDAINLSRRGKSLPGSFQE